MFGFNDLIKPLLHLPVREVTSNWGSYLALDFGDYHEDEERYDWVLWIYSCNWYLYQDGQLLVDSSTKRQDIKTRAQILRGAVLEKIELNSADGESEISFSRGLVLQTGPYSNAAEKQDEQWLLFTPDNMVFIYRYDGQYSFSPGNTLPVNENWLPLS